VQKEAAEKKKMLAHKACPASHCRLAELLLQINLFQRASLAVLVQN